MTDDENIVLTVANGGLALGIGWTDDPDNPLSFTKTSGGVDVDGNPVAGTLTLDGNAIKVQPNASKMAFRVVDPTFWPVSGQELRAVDPEPEPEPEPCLL